MILSDLTTEDLRRECAELGQQNGQLKAKVAELEKRVDLYEEQIRLLNHNRFASSSEKTPVGQEAFVFDEAEALANSDIPEPTVEEAISTVRKKKQKGHRQAQLALLDVRNIEHPATPEQLVCECCHEQMEFMKWETTEKVEYQPAKLIHEMHKQPVYVCRHCQEEGEKAPIHSIATMPAQAFPKSIASPSLVASIVNEKFVMGAPLYRQEQHIERQGLFISRQTMANWMIAGSNLLAPFYKRLHSLLLERHILHADETKLQVLKEPGRAATTGSTMWLYRSGRDGPPIVLYEYRTSRAGHYAKEFLKGFSGYDPATNRITVKKYLTCDGHEGYDRVPEPHIIDGDEVYDIILTGCLAHARRKFDEALCVLDKELRKSGKMTTAEEGLKYCNDLFDIEREYKDATPEERLIARQEKSAPIVEAFKKWLDKQAASALPKFKFGEAVAYCLRQWKKLIVFLEDGRVEIDNNRAERSIKPFVIGRKNFLFCNTPRGATASAILYSVVETAKENGLIPYEYLKYLFEQLPNVSGINNIAQKDETIVDKLLPWSDTIPDYCRKTTASSR